MKDYEYVCCCTDLFGNEEKVAALNKMLEDNQQTNYRAVQRHCRGLLEWSQKIGYAARKSDGLTLRHDRMVGFYRSKWLGRPCYYVLWSAIEFIWVKFPRKES